MIDSAGFILRHIDTDVGATLIISIIWVADRGAEIHVLDLLRLFPGLVRLARLQLGGWGMQETHVIWSRTVLL